MTTDEYLDIDRSSVTTLARAMRLNGWQRLWVVLAVIWTVVV